MVEISGRMSFNFAVGLLMKIGNSVPLRRGMFE